MVGKTFLQVLEETRDKKIDLSVEEIIRMLEKQPDGVSICCSLGTFNKAEQIQAVRDGTEFGKYLSDSLCASAAFEEALKAEGLWPTVDENASLEIPKFEF